MKKYGRAGQVTMAM